MAWHCYQRLRSIYHARSPAEGRRLAEQAIASLLTCPISEIARLGRTVRAWRAQVLAYFDTGGVSNGGTEAFNLLIERPAASPTDKEPSPTTGQVARVPGYRGMCARTLLVPTSRKFVVFPLSWPRIAVFSELG